MKLGYITSLQCSVITPLIDFALPKMLGISITACDSIASSITESSLQVNISISAPQSRKAEILEYLKIKHYNSKEFKSNITIPFKDLENDTMHNNYDLLMKKFMKINGSNIANVDLVKGLNNNDGGKNKQMLKKTNATTTSPRKRKASSLTEINGSFSSNLQNINNTVRKASSKKKQKKQSTISSLKSIVSEKASSLTENNISSISSILQNTNSTMKRKIRSAKKSKKQSSKEAFESIPEEEEEEEEEEKEEKEEEVNRSFVSKPIKELRPRFIR